MFKLVTSGFETVSMRASVHSVALFSHHLTLSPHDQLSAPDGTPEHIFSRRRNSMHATSDDFNLCPFCPQLQVFLQASRSSDPQRTFGALLDFPPTITVSTGFRVHLS
ncbi:hypothetical protein H2248_009008 [Termitomyces sp. 'cryptogamus']|nr:hypothetical protein H2248_009008 [Termitomyces sp. 'cryptogamus']